MRIENEGHGFDGWSGQSHPPDRKLWESIGKPKPLSLERRLEIARNHRESYRTSLELLQNERDKYLTVAPLQLILDISEIRAKLPELIGRIGGLTAAKNRSVKGAQI